MEKFFLKKENNYDNVKKEEIRIIEALIFASEKSISIVDLKKKLPNVKILKKFCMIYKNFIRIEV